MPDRKIKDRLKRFENEITGQSRKSLSFSSPAHYKEMARCLGGQLISNHSGSFILVKHIFKNGTSLGRAKLDIDRAKSLIPFDFFSTIVNNGSAPLKSLLFLDTETTGLGGSGAVAFLVGFGSVTKEGFEVRQYLIPDYSDETAMLESLLDEFGKSKTLVSFNGAAFDLPLLRTRMILNRTAREIDCCHHLDLLHPARRLFKRRLKDCSLTNLERELFKFNRKDDIPGYLIPSVYFDWLSERKLDGMFAVMKHNRLDILSLYFLLQHMVDVFVSDGSSLNEVDDLHSLSRIYGKRKETSKAMNLHEKIESLGTQNLAGDILLFKSMTLKKLRKFDQALNIWNDLAQYDNREGFLAALEIAKYLEHKEKDFLSALRMTKRAKEIAPSLFTVKTALTKRVGRLKTKIAGLNQHSRK